MPNNASSDTKIARLHYAGAAQFVAESPSGHSIVTSFATGDNVTAPTPMELLLIALGGCSGADVASILEKKRQHVSGYDIEVRGERRAQPPRVYTSIAVIHRVRGRNIDPKAVADAIHLSETKYCSVSAMLSAGTKITMTFEITNES
jgi:putative redox protein